MIRYTKILRLVGMGLIVMLITNCQYCTPRKTTQKARYVLAYVKDASSDIRVRWSDEGLNWHEGNFPDSAVTPGFDGVGAAVDDRGLLHIITANGTDCINFVWGLGPELWDSYDVSETTHPPTSAPSCIYLGDSRWLVAFRRSDNTVMASVYDTQERRFVIPDVAPMHSLNSSVNGRPVLTSIDGKILLAWRRNTYSLVTSVGYMGNGMPSFSTPQEISIPIDTVYVAGINGDPDVTSDTSNFYIAYVRKEISPGGEGMTPFGVEVRSSSDGLDWEVHSSGRFLGVVQEEYVNIAALADGTLMAASVDYRGMISAARYSGDQWNTLSGSQIQAMFGAAKASPRQFALISTNITTSE